MINNNKIFSSSLLKIDKKSYENIDIYYIGYIKIKLVLVIMKVLIVQIFCTLLLVKQMDTLK